MSGLKHGPSGEPGASAEPGTPIPEARPGRSARPFWVATIGSALCTGLLVLAGVAGFTATTSGTPDWLRGLEQAMVAAPAVGLVSGISAQRRAFVSWRRSPWTALRVDADGLTVTAHARTHARDATSTYTVAWDLVEQVGVSGNGAASWVVVWFVAGTFPTSAEASAWAQERGAQLRYPGDPGVLNLCQPARGAGEDEAERIVARAREAIRASAGPRAVDLDRVGRPLPQPR